MDNSSQSSQEFLPLDYNYDEIQEDLINVEDMILSDDEKEYDNDPMFDLEQSLYDAENIPILQEISKEDLGCTTMHLDNTKTALLNFAKLIEMSAYSENDIIKKNLLQALIPCMENFNLDSSSASFSKLPSLFVVNTIFKIKKIDFSKQKFIQKSKKYEEFEKSLALEVLNSHTSLAPYKSILESPAFCSSIMK
ncbi:2222_t:CDS:2 [Gigaspora margarita]|uniref:2222_t:CDS:1 n=1 Tax=Gigaspora margarita TaxID=4874 RepID=A0ABN7UV72_GIGMA|nr:2222_t:CDS:2 [Gigaspora margarita]